MIYDDKTVTFIYVSHLKQPQLIKVQHELKTQYKISIKYVLKRPVIYRRTVSSDSSGGDAEMRQTEKVNMIPASLFMRSM